MYDLGPLAPALARQSWLWLYTVPLLYMATVFFLQYSVAVQFLFRYHAICREELMSVQAYILWMAAVGALSTMGALAFHLGNAIKAEDRHTTAILYLTESGASTKIPRYIKSDTYTLATYVYSIIGLIATYTIVGYCSVRTYFHMKHAFALVPPGSPARRLAGQLNTALLIQALIPVALELVPVVILVYPALVGLNASKSECTLQPATQLGAVLQRTGDYTRREALSARVSEVRHVLHVLPL